MELPGWNDRFDFSKYPPLEGEFVDIANDEERHNLEARFGAIYAGDRKRFNSAVVQYRCPRGCLLGAYAVPFDGAYVWVYSAHFMYLDRQFVADRLQAHDSGEEPIPEPEMVRRFRLLISNPEWDELQTPDQNAVQRELGTAMRVERFAPEVTFISPLRDVEPSFYLPGFECPHVISAKTVGQVLDDIQELKGRRGNTVRISTGRQLRT